MAPQTAPAALDTGNSWVLDSGSPRPPSSVNSVSRQNGARGRALTSRPFPSPFPFLHSLPADGGMAQAPANGRTPSARATQSMPGTRGFKPIKHYHSQKSRKKPGLLLATTNPDSFFAGLGQLPLAGLEGSGPSPGACAPGASQ